MNEPSDMPTNITADELFERVSDILNVKTPSEMTNRQMHETLLLCCAEGLRDTRHGFGNLSSQVDSLCKRHHVKPADTAAIQKMRRDCNSQEAILPEDLLYDCRALCLFIAAVFETSIPSTIIGRIPPTGKPVTEGSSIDYIYIRCIVQSWNEETMRVTIDQDGQEELLTVDYRHTPSYIDLSYLHSILKEGMQLNLLDCEVNGKTVIPRLVVVEPDFLIDISTLAGCFEDYGHHPLMYTLNRLKPRANTRHIILGNFAGAALDGIINDEHFQPSNTFKSNFREQALSYATCSDLNPAEFKTEAMRQIGNMREIVDDIFKQHDREKAILEPSFICERLGIQGRVDLMTTDMKLLVEQKAGRNIFIERNQKNRHGSLHIEKHYVQVLLYFGILAYNFHVSGRQTDIRLLYSKYALPDGLLEVQPLQMLFREAIKLRNMIVAEEYHMAQDGFECIIDRLTPDTMNTEQRNDFFFTRYLLPELQQITAPLHSLSPLEHAYFCRMATFILKEQLLSKVGTASTSGNAVSDLWNMPLTEKLETGNIYLGLHIVRKEKNDPHTGYDMLTLIVPEQNSDFLPNFRRGDMIYLYSYPTDKEPDVRKSILHKGVITEISSAQLTIHLNNGQFREDLFPDNLCYAIEHGGSDVTSSAALAGMHQFISAPPDRKALLLGQREPQRDDRLKLSRSYHPDYDEILLKAKQALDYFLLVGPPGTGKTSMALRFIVEEELASPARGDASILLMSYTNRAVDEICEMLCKAGIPFVRLGSEFSCDPQFKPFLLSQAVEDHPRLYELQDYLRNIRVVVGTTSTMISRPFIFAIKDFSLAVIDEASQILEPNIIGLLAAHYPGNAIARFILIGDHKQLPAVVQQSEEESRVDNPLLQEIGLTNCRNSLFERLIRHEHNKGRESFIGILHRQGRMHPEISRWPCQTFYRHERIEPVPLPHQTETSDKPRLVFIPSEKCYQPELSDKVNTSEAAIVAQELLRVYNLYKEDFDPDKTAGVIVPYRNQIAMIRKEIERLGIKPLEQISIDTVERYQGSQRDVIIYSFTIQHNYQLDFLTSNCFEEDGVTIDRKLNVAMTRARRQLILTGNEQTLRHNPLFAGLLDFIREKGCYKTI